MLIHQKKGGKGNTLPIPVRCNGVRLHIDGHTPADVYLAHGSRFYKFPVSVGSREYRAQPVLPLSLVQLLFQVDIEQVIRGNGNRSEEHTSELQSRGHLVCRLLLDKK